MMINLLDQALRINLTMKMKDHVLQAWIVIDQMMMKLYSMNLLRDHQTAII